jgi:hypothetical protein
LDTSQIGAKTRDKSLKADDHPKGASVRYSIPLSAILLPAALLFSVLTPDATRPNGLIYLAYVGAVILAAGLLILGIGLIRKPRQAE